MVLPSHFFTTIVDTFFSCLLHCHRKVTNCRYLSKNTSFSSLSSVPQICRRKLPNDAISHRLRKLLDPNYVKKLGQIAMFPIPFSQAFRFLWHTPSTAQLVRCLLVALARTPTFTGCRLMWGVIWVPKSSIKHHQAAHAWAPGTVRLGTHTTVPLGALLKYHARLNAFYIPYHPSDWNIYLHFSWFLW